MRFISIDGGGCDDGLKFSTRGGVRRSRLVSKRRLDAYNGQKKEGGGLKFIYVQEIARVANAGVMRSREALKEGSRDERKLCAIGDDFSLLQDPLTSLQLDKSTSASKSLAPI